MNGPENDALDAGFLDRLRIGPDRAAARRLGEAGRAFVEGGCVWPLLIRRFAADLESRRK
jgi:hypothetical protein